MTRRAAVLDALEPEAVVTMNRTDMQRLGLQPADQAIVSTRRGSIELQVRQDDGLGDGSIFVPFAFAEAAANLLTNPALDPSAKIPEFKFCAARVQAKAQA